MQTNLFRNVEVAPPKSPLNASSVSVQAAKSSNESLDSLRRDSYNEVMAHEMEHKSKAGAYAGSIVIEFDGNGIAVGGHVPISMPPIQPQNLQSSIQAYQMIRDAALAPKAPSSADISVANHALSLLGKAQLLLSQQKNSSLPQQKTQPGD